MVAAFLDTIGLYEELIKKYVKYREAEEKKEKQQGFDFLSLIGQPNSAFSEGELFN